MDLLLLWLGAAAVTIVVETVILAAAGYRTKRFLAVCVLINLATNLSLNLGLTLLPGVAYWAVLYPGEVAVVVIEWLVLRLVAEPVRMPNGRLLGFVLAANVASFLCGPLLFW